MSLDNVKQVKSTGGTIVDTVSVTLDSAPVAGNTLIAIHWHRDTEGGPVSPPEPWTRILEYTTGVDYRDADVWTLPVTESTGQTHTFEESLGTVTFQNLIIVEIEGVVGVSVPGSTDAGSVTSISMPASGGLSGLTVGRTLLTCITGSSGTWDGYTQPSGYTLVDSSAGGSLAGKEITATTEPEATHSWGSSVNNVIALAIELDIASTAPTTRKSSTFDIETALGTITTATLNSVNVFDHVTGQVGTTVSFAGAATDEITTSGEYDLVLGDGTGTETIAVQVNVVGLASFNINKDGADQGSLTDVEFIILTGAAGSRAINQQITGITTTAGGDTGPIEITDTALNVDDTITVVQQSPTVGGGLVHTATLGLI